MILLRISTRKKGPQEYLRDRLAFGEASSASRAEERMYRERALSRRSLRSREDENSLLFLVLSPHLVLSMLFFETDTLRHFEPSSLKGGPKIIIQRA